MVGRAGGFLSYLRLKFRFAWMSDFVSINQETHWGFSCGTTFPLSQCFSNCGTRRYRPTVFTMPSDHDVTITSAVHFVSKLIDSNYILVLLRHKFTTKKTIAFSVCLSYHLCPTDSIKSVFFSIS